MVLLGTALTLCASLSLGLAAGLFFIFSIDVMPAFDRIEPAQAVAAMRSINETIRSPIFFAVFFGSPILCLLAAIALGLSSRMEPALWIAAAGVTYGLGVFVVTVAINVPLNEAMEGAAEPVANASTIWRDFSPDWTFWNHVRTVFNTLALLLALVALVRL